MLDYKHTIMAKHCKLIPGAKYNVYCLITGDLLNSSIIYEEAELNIENRKFRIILKFTHSSYGDIYLTEEDFQKYYRLELIKSND